MAEVWRVLRGRHLLRQYLLDISDARLLRRRARDAALVYNAFEKIRDPSHGRCFGMAEWTEVLSDTGLEVLHKERVPKEMEFQPWAERLGSDAATIGRLRSMLTEGTPALKAFLKPRQDDGGKLWFTLDEAIVIARKPG